MLFEACKNSQNEKRVICPSIITASANSKIASIWTETAFFEKQENLTKVHLKMALDKNGIVLHDHRNIEKMEFMLTSCMVPPDDFSQKPLEKLVYFVMP